MKLYLIVNFLIILLLTGCSAGGGSAVDVFSPGADDSVITPEPPVDYVGSVDLFTPASSPNFSVTPVIRVANGGVVNGATVTIYTDASCTSVRGTAVAVGSEAYVSVNPAVSTDGTYLFYAKVMTPEGSSNCSSDRNRFATYIFSSALGPIATGLSDFTLPAQTRTWNWSCSTLPCDYRFVINTNSVHAFTTEPYGATTTTTQPTGDGVFYLHIQPRDSALVEGFVQSYSALLDNTDPTISISSPSLGAYVNNLNASAFPFSGTCSEDGQNVNITISDGVNPNVIASTPCTSSAWSFSLDVTSLDDGALTVTADTSDIAGNTSNDSVAINKDATIPLVNITSAPNIELSNINPYIATGTCSENTRNVTVSIGAITTNVTCTSGSWTTSVDVTSVPDSGSVIVTADHTDVAGNNAVQDSTTVTKDTTPPAVTINALTVINVANETTYSLAGTCTENGRNITLSIGGVPSTPTCSFGAWSVGSVNVSAALEGTITVTADHDDALGNNATQATQPVFKDTIIPTVSIDALALITNSNRTTYSLSGACSENGQNISVSIGGVVGSSNCSGLNWNIASINVSGAAEGTITVTADHVDTSGNNATQATRNVLKDTVGPVVTIFSPNPINLSNANNYSLSGTCSENGLTVNVDVGGVTSSPICSAGVWTATAMNLTGIADNPAVAITADHTDAAGNTATQVTDSVLKDVVIPTVSITSLPVITTSNESSYDFSGSCSENGRTVTVDVDGIPSTTICSVTSWTITGLNVSGASEGTITVSADTDDAAGNNATQESQSILKDAVIPTVAITVFPGVSAGNVTTYSVSGTCSENSQSVAVDIGGVGTSAICTALSWTATADVTAAAEGTITVTADLNDNFGNSATQATQVIFKDTVDPTVSITTNTTIFTGNVTTYSVSGTCSDSGESVAVNIDGVGVSATCMALSWTATADVTAASEGTITVTADHSDALGNSAPQATQLIFKDAVIPTVAITVFPGVSTGNVTTYSVSGTCSENSQNVAVDIGGVGTSAICTALSWTATADVTAAAEGTITVTANLNDNFGNSATQATQVIFKDTVDPIISITTNTTVFTGNVTTYSVSGTCSDSGENVAVNIDGVGASATCMALSWTATADVTAASEGTITVTADHNDAFGNSAVQATQLIFKDTVIPTVAITVFPGVNAGNVTTYSVSGTCSENSQSVAVDIDGVGTSAICTALSWTATADVTAAAEGTITVTADLNDSFGNSATQATQVIFKDTVDTTVSITTDTTVFTGNVTTYSVSGTCSDSGESVAVNIDGVGVSATCMALSWTATVDVTAASEGTITVTADHNDAFGGSAVQATQLIFKDTVIPTVAITAAPSVTNGNVTIYSVSGSCSENSQSVSIDIDGVGTSVTCTALSWTATTDITGASEGTITVAVNLNDVSGNAAVQATQLILKDTIIPTVTISSTPVIFTDNVSAYSFAGSCSENGELVTVSVGGVGASATCTALSWTATADVTAAAEGTITVTADINDAVGNSAVQATQTVFKDTIIPIVTLTSLSSITISNDSSYTVTGTCSENGQNISIDIGGVTASPLCLGGGFTTGGLDVSGLLDGTVTVTADLIDASGNSAVQDTIDLLKDTLAPMLAIVSSPSILSENEAAYPISGTCSEEEQTVNVNTGGIASSGICTAGNWSVTVDVSSGVADGTVTITAVLLDTVGNDLTVTVDVMKNTEIPNVTGFTCNSGSAVLNGTSAIICNLSFDEPVDATTLSTSDLTLTAGSTGSPSIASISPSSGNSTSFTINLNSIADDVEGLLSIELAAASLSDTHGNAAPSSPVQTTAIVIDTDEPEVSSFSCNSGGAVLDGTTSFSCSLIFDQQVDATSVGLGDFTIAAGSIGTGNILSKTPGAGLNTTYTININSIDDDVDGSFSLEIAAGSVVDTNGNIGVTSLTSTTSIAIDTDEPVLTGVIDVSSNDAGTTQAVTAIFSGMASTQTDFNRVEYSINLDLNTNGTVDVGEQGNVLAWQDITTNLNSGGGFDLNNPATWLDFQATEAGLGIDFDGTALGATDLTGSNDYSISIRVGDDDGNQTIYTSDEWSLITIPTDITGNYFWLDAQDISTLYQDTGCSVPVTSTADPVNCWENKGTDGSNFIKSSGVAAYDTGTGTGVGVHFDGDVFIANGVFSGNLDDVSVFVVQTEVANTSSFDFNLNHPQTGAGRYSVHFPWTDRRIYWDSGGCCGPATRISALVPYAVGDTNINNVTNSAGLNRRQIIVDGDVLNEATNVTNAAASNFAFGTGANSIVHEIIFYRPAPSEVQRKIIEGALACRWDIRDQLSVSHPYYNAVATETSGCP